MNKSLIISDKKKILLRDSHPTRLTAVISTAKIVSYRGTELVVVPHEIDEVKVLNNMGYDLPSPIGYDYHWPSRYPAPMAHQIVTSSNLTLSKRHFVLSEIGSGKSLSALWAFDYLRRIGKAKSMLIVTPLSTMETVWANEIWEHTPHLTCQVLYGDAKRRVGQLEYPADIYVINHDGIKVPEILKALIARKDLNVLCVDELADFKNAATDRWKALKKLSEGREFFWGMTGTPIPNKVVDAWAQCRLISPERVPPYFGRFRDQVMRQVSQFKWVARDNALEIVKEAMQPATLFKRDECIDLPPTMYETRHVPLSKEQTKAYTQMMKSLVAEAGAGQIVAVNEAVKMSKLLQITCIAHGTPVLCRRGWVDIQNVLPSDEVWDGVEWVCHSGVVLKGVRQVIECGGVCMTPDHLVLSDNGWVPAEDMKHGYASSKLNWAKVRIPDGYEAQRVNQRKGKVRSVGVCLRLWSSSNEDKSILEKQAAYKSQELRMPSRERNAQNGVLARVRNLGKTAKKVSKSDRQRLEKLRGAWNTCVRKMARVFREFLGGYARWLCGRLDYRQKGCEWGLLQKELSMGYGCTTREQPQNECSTQYASRRDDCLTSSTTLRTFAGNTGGEAVSVRMELGKSLDHLSGHAEVFDITNCGPRNRFVVRGVGEELRIVHNCGAAYAQDGTVLHIKADERVEELKKIIEASQGKVIVFIPLTGGLHSVAKEIGKEWQTETVYGDVSKSERARIFAEFKQPGGLHVIVAHPRVMAHGLTLTEANTIVWFIPTNNPNEYTQANGRITRPGQKRNTFIVHLEGSEIERRMYKRLKDKGDLQGVLLGMIKEGQK